jgi:hypothetical protein
MSTQLRSIALIALTLVFATPANSMSFSVERRDLRPIQGIEYRIYGSGEIIDGDSERLLNVVQAKKLLKDSQGEKASVVVP